jgi:hypothetical protein
MPSTAKHYFEPVERTIRQLFSEILSEFGHSREIALDIVDADEMSHPTRLNQARTVFEAIVPGGPVRISWDGLASLWFCCFGAIRIGERLFHERRAAIDRMKAGEPVQVTIDEPLRHGLGAINIAQLLTTQPLGRWSNRLPLPTPTPDPDKEIARVMLIFFGALGWILRHEVAHIVLGHQETQTAEIMKQDEFAADAQATAWLKGDRQRDQYRVLGSRPSDREMSLDARAIWMGMGLLWVALFEEHRGRVSTDHPEISTRFDRCATIFDLSDDSGAAEILSDVVKSWLDPEGAWITSTDPNVATARAALDEALFRLQRHIQSKANA